MSNYTLLHNMVRSQAYSREKYIKAFGGWEVNKDKQLREVGKHNLYLIEAKSTISTDALFHKIGDSQLIMILKDNRCRPSLMVMFVYYINDDLKMLVEEYRKRCNLETNHLKTYNNIEIGDLAGIITSGFLDTHYAMTNRQGVATIDYLNSGVLVLRER